MTTANTTRVERTGHLRWVKVADLAVNDRAQREMRPGWAAQIATEFDPDRFTPPLVSRRDGKNFVVDGQHRVEAMRILGWADQEIQCWVYEGLTEQQEADLFLWHNNTKQVRAFDKFVIGITADRPAEVDIDRIVRAQGLVIGDNGSGPGAIHAVGALRKVYAHGPNVLARTLRIIVDSYGDDGLEGKVIEGIGMVCARYNGQLDDDEAVRKLGQARGGKGGLMTKAYGLRKQLGRPVTHCVAGAAVEIINSGKGGKKLPGWWS